MSSETNSNADSVRTEPDSSAFDDEFFGRMSDPSGSAFVRGLCGDEMEFYLVIEDMVITQVKYFSKGCLATKLCGQAVAKRVKGKDLFEALSVNPKQIIDTETSLPMENRHCAILAVSAMYRAVAEYLLKP